MRLKKLLISAVALLLPGAVAIASQYDYLGTAGGELVESSDVPANVNGESAVFMYPHLGEPDESGNLVDVGVTMAARFDTDGAYRYESCQSIALLADGEVVPVAESSWSGDRDASGSKEMVYASLTMESLQALVGADEIAYRVCAVEVAIEPAQQEKLRELYHRVKAVNGPSVN